MDPSIEQSSSSAWYRMDLGLVGCCRMIHTDWVLHSQDMARNRHCSDDAELRLPIF